MSMASIFDEWCFEKLLLAENSEKAMKSDRLIFQMVHISYSRVSSHSQSKAVVML